MNRSNAIEKVLSKNDTGETGGHQAGILIPKSEEILSFFPDLNIADKNPRRVITFHDQFDEIWKFTFIYYNNYFYGGTRNEYRLTGMTKYFNRNNLKSGDSLTLTRNEYEIYHIGYLKRNENCLAEGKILKLGSTWRVINI